MARGFLAGDAPPTLLGLEGLGAIVADDLRFVLRGLSGVDPRRSAAENARRGQVAAELEQATANALKALIVAAPALVAVDAALDASDGSAEGRLVSALRDACYIGSDAVRLWAAGVNVMGVLKPKGELT